MAAPLVRPYQQLKVFSNVSSAEQEVRTHIAVNKISEAKVLLEAKTALYATPTSQNTLFRLPREIRDKIYDYAFGTTPLILKSGGLLILTTCGNRKSGYQTSDRDDIGNFELESTTVQGLPTWLRSNKQICSEALEVLGTFTAVYDEDPRLGKYRARYLRSEKRYQRCGVPRPPSSPLGQ